MSSSDDRKSLVHCLLHWEAKTPDRVFLTQPINEAGDVATYTWTQVADEVRRMAAYLKATYPADSKIAILGKNSAHWFMADLAILMAGHVSVPIYPTMDAPTITYVLEHSDSKAIVVGKMQELWKFAADGLPKKLPIISTPLSPFEDGSAAAPKGVAHWDEIIAKTPPFEGGASLIDPAALATIHYTSGSTGQPKGVMHSHETMLTPALGLEKIFHADENDRFLSYLPLAHVAEREAVETLSLYFGGSVFFAWTLDTFVEDLQRAQPTIFFSVPRLWTKFYQGVSHKLPLEKQRVLFKIPILNKVIKKKVLTQLGLNHVRVALTGSAPLPAHIISWYRTLGLELLEVYGMTENAAYSHANRPGRVKVGTVGEANPGVEHRVDPESGELLVKSPGQMLGYYKNPEKTAEDLTEDGFLKTGDMAEIDKDGYAKITGRVKDLFKTSKGKYVAPVPIENKLAVNSAIEVVCVAGFDLPQPIALMMLSEEAQKRLAEDGASKEALTKELASLREEVNATLPPHEHLSKLIVVHDQWTMDNGMLTPTMKIKRAVIEKFYADKVPALVKESGKVVWA
ncbi:AMP-binding protein [Smaragdicoccus niigatensis]|uniref:AMP-binding protein n=1 Tax=Smaragdicoccus niigatensis TaxID=359359 RepID=UPI00037B664A|nr:AMP-binding protein [Smaragdicoccus niigatensis]